MIKRTSVKIYPSTQIFILASLLSVQSFAQVQQAPFGQRDEVPVIVSFFAPFFFPKIIQDDFQLKEYIRSNAFAELKVTNGDLHAVDAIFDKAMRLSWNNIYEALLISFVATMDHSKFGVKIPLLGPLLWVPLTSEFDDEFTSRVNALPSKLYDDSPPGRIGDRDKLQHFFGSAFLAYVFESRDAAQRIGEFIEWGEDKVIVDGALDERDFRANTHGQDFGLKLLEDENVLPSMFFRFSIARLDSQSVMERDLGTDSLEFMEKR